MIKLSTMTLRLSRSEDKQRMNTGIEIRKSHRLKEVHTSRHNSKSEG